MRYVVDTNVAVLANGRDTHVGIVGQLKAARFLRALMENGVALEDCEDLAFSEYRRHLQFSGQPSMGDIFFRWFYLNRWNGGLVERIAGPNGASIMSVLPSGLIQMDVDDHKWICIYLQGGADYIVNAVDSDWAQNASSLEAEGVRVFELLNSSSPPGT